MSDAAASQLALHRRPRRILCAVAAFWTLVGGSLHSVGWSASLTILLFVATIFLLPCAMDRRPGNSVRDLEAVNPLRAGIPLPLWGFAAYVTASALHQQSNDGVQNAVVYLSFVAVTALSAAWTSAGSSLQVLRWVRTAAVIGACAYLATVPFYGPGNNAVFTARVYGEVVWIGLVTSLALSRQTRWGYSTAFFLFTACVLSLSRTCMAVCAALILLSVARDRVHARVRFGKIILPAAVMAVGAYFLVTEYEPLHERFTNNDGQEVVGMQIGTSGRAEMWRITWESIKEAPWTGHGIGSAEHLLAFHAHHPHNDYLRLWHDFGFIGLSLWAASIVILGYGSYRRWRSATNDSDRAIHYAAFLALVGLSLNVITSNLLVYIFVMTPVGVIVGTSLGRANADETPSLRRPVAIGPMRRPATAPTRPRALAGR